MKNIFKYLGKSLGVGFLALAIVVGVGAGSAGATLTLDATSITTTGAFTVTSVAGTTANMFAANTTGDITIGGTGQTSGTTLIYGGTDAGVGTAAGLSLTPGTAGTLVLGAVAGTGAITLGSSTAGQTVNIGTGVGGANTNTVHIADTSSGSTGVNLVTIGDNSAVASITTIKGGNGATAINLTPSNAGGIVIGTATQTTNGTIIYGGTGVGTNASGISGIALTPGVAGTINIGAAAGTGAITLGSSTAGQTVNIGTGVGGANNNTVHIADTSSGSTGVNLVTIGDNSAVASITTIKGGNGATAINLTPSNAGGIVIGTATQTTNGTIIYGGTGVGTNASGISGIALTPGVAGTINIGAAAGTGAITLGSSTAGQTVNIGSGAVVGSDIVNIGTGTATVRKTVNIATEAISTTNIGTGNFVNTIHIGDNATPVNLITIGGAASSLALLDADWGITTAGAVTGLTGITSTMVTDDTLTATDLAATLTFADGDYVNMAAANQSTTLEGLRLPQAVDCTTNATVEGVICWETGNDRLVVGNGTTGTVITPGTASANTWTNVNTFQDNEIFTLAGDEDIAVTNASADTNDVLSLTVTGSTGDVQTDGMQINYTVGNDANVDTTAALNLAVTSVATGDADVLVGLNIANLTGADATVLERALVIGSGWDVNQYFNDTTTFVKLANGGTFVLEDDSLADGVDLLSITDAGAIAVGTAVNTSISLTTDNNAANDIALVGGVTVTGSLVPEAATTRSLGGTSAEWGNIYVGDGSAADISTTGLIFGLDQDAILVYEENTSDRVELVGTNADLWIEDVLSLGSQTLTVTDNGVADDTLTPTASYVELTQDATANGGTPDVTVSETGVKEGDLLIVVRIDGNAGNVTINEADTVVESAGNITLSPSEFDSVTYIYTGTTWVQIAASENG